MVHVQVSYGVAFFPKSRRSKLSPVESQVVGAKRSVHKSYGKHDVATMKTPCQFVHKTVDYPMKVLDTQFKKTVVKKDDVVLPEKKPEKPGKGPRNKYLVNLKRERVKKFLQL